MTSENSQVMDTARAWMLRIDDPAFEGWDDFTIWLEADPAHLEAYDAAVEEDAWAADAVRQTQELWRPAPAPAPVEDDHRVAAAGGGGVLAFTRPRQVWGGAIAASLVAAMVWTTMFREPDMTEISTAPGEHRSIALSDGSRIEVNGNSLVTYDPEDPRRITLARGEALFEVDHDAANPFIVTVGETRLIDAGTIFNVVNDGDALDVAVAEGVVIYDHGEDEVRLEPGDRLMRSMPGAKVEVVRADPGSIGTWRQGMLHYDNAPLREIARDLSRAVGKPVRVAAGAGDQRFTGSLAVAGRERDMLKSAGALLGVTMTETEDMWEMKPGDGPPR